MVLAVGVMCLAVGCAADSRGEADASARAMPAAALEWNTGEGAPPAASEPAAAPPAATGVGRSVPRLELVRDAGSEQVFEIKDFPPGSGAVVYRPSGVTPADVGARMGRPTEPGGALSMTIKAGREGVFAYTLVVQSRDRSAFESRAGLLVNLRWMIESFALEPGAGGTTDEAFRRAWAGGRRPALVRGALDLNFGEGSPDDLEGAPKTAGDAARVPVDGFGTRATCAAAMTPGRYRLIVSADEGVRVRVGALTDQGDGDLVIDAWSRTTPADGHDAASVSGEFEVKAAASPAATLGPSGTVPMKIVVEAFDVAGPSHLSLKIECVKGVPELKRPSAAPAGSTIK